MKIYIKNIVCERCCLAVSSTLKNIEAHYESVSLGEIDFADNYGENLPCALYNNLLTELERLGFLILNTKKSKLIESVKIFCLEYINKIESLNGQKLSKYLSERTHLEYNYVSNLFSAVEGITIEKYFIRLRIEKVKELLVYAEMSTGEISFHLGFSNVAHLSSQFKKQTGLTPGHFRILKNEKLRVPLDEL